MSILTRPTRSVRALAVAAAAALAVGVAGCGDDGGKSTGAEPGAVASFIPAGAPMYAEVSTDFAGPQWTQLQALAAKFPAFPDLREKLTEGFESEGVDFARDVQPLLGKDAAVGLLEVKARDLSSGALTTPGAAAAAADDQPFVAAVEIAEGKDADALAFVTKKATKAGTIGGVDYYRSSDPDDDGIVAVTDGTVLFAEGEAELKAALDAHAAGGDATVAGNDKVTDTLGKLPADVFAQVYVDLGAVLKQSSNSSAQLKQLEAFGLSTDTAFGLSLSAEPTGLRLKGVVTGSGAKAVAGTEEFTPTLTANVPGDALAYVGFNNLAGLVASALDTLKKANPDVGSQISALSAQLPVFLGGVTVDDLKALTQKEHALVVTRGGAYPTGALLLQVDDAARAQKTLDGLKALVPLIAGQIGADDVPSWRTVTEAGVTGQELPLSEKAGVVYGTKDGLAVVGTQPAALALLTAPAASLAADKDFADATVGMPDKVGALAWIDVQGIVETANALGAFDSADEDAQEALANLKPLKSLVAWSTVDDGVPTVEA
ncbi:MAG: DUF3352 domain-containing protein, partial [Actinomycetota bacterium]